MIRAILDDSGLRRLTRAVGAETLRCIAVARNAGAEIRAAQFGDTVVVDPALLTPFQLRDCTDAVRAAGLPLVLFTTTARIDAREILRIASLADIEIVFHGAIDEIAIFRRMVHRTVRASGPALLLACLHRRIERLPPALISPTLGPFGWLPIPESTDHFAAQCECHRRTCEQHFLRVGFGGVARLLDGVRLVRAWTLRQSGQSTSMTADGAGYASSRRLAEHTSRFVGTTFERAYRRMSSDEFTSAVCAAIVRVE